MKEADVRTKATCVWNLSIHAKHGLHRDIAATSRQVDRSNVMVVFLATSLWKRERGVALHIDRVWFVFPTHTFFVQ